MTTVTATNWREANWRYLSAAIVTVQQAIARLVHQESPSTTAPETASETEHKWREQWQSLDPAAQPFAIDRLCTIFSLSSFERDILLVCTGIELDASLATLCGQAQGNLQHSYPTFNLMLAVSPHAYWSALLPKAPLRHWRLIEVEPGRTLTHSPIRIDERILHYLIGEQYLDDRFQGIIHPTAALTHLVPSHQQIAEQIVELWRQGDDRQTMPIVQLCGVEFEGKQAIAATAATLTGQNLHTLSAQNLPTSPADLNTLILLWNREAQLTSSTLLIDCDAVDTTEATKRNTIAQLIAGIRSRLLVSSHDRDAALFAAAKLTRQQPVISFTVHPPTTAEQRLLWQSALTSSNADLNGQVETLVAQFNLDAARISAVCAEWQSGGVVEWRGGGVEEGRGGDDRSVSSPSTSLNQLWDLCRAQSRPQMDDLAQPIEATANWQDLVLPETQKQVLRAIVAHVQQRSRVYETWGFGRKGKRGLGISALFAGASGTGKTMAAEVLAQELRLDLYRIDLSAVVSKYIGETEKNLRRIFDAAESGSVVLLFDEADALFGKRSEVKDSHDRYANMEVSYLLQRMEAYQGLAILTTNMKEAIDTAFLRRLRFIVKFPFPDVPQREEIWRRIFPKDTPIETLDVSKLARLNVAGGNIRNIALNAAFIAADAGEKVNMHHLLEAARGEYGKLERTLTDAEVRGWIS